MVESCRLYAWVVSHIWMSHIPHVNEGRGSKHVDSQCANPGSLHVCMRVYVCVCTYGNMYVCTYVYRLRHIQRHAMGMILRVCGWVGVCELTFTPVHTARKPEFYTSVWKCNIHICVCIKNFGREGVYVLTSRYLFIQLYVYVCTYIYIHIYM